MQVLKDYLSATGMDQAELARRIGVDPAQLNRWLRGRGTPTLRWLKAIHAATGIKAERLLSDEALEHKRER